MAAALWACAASAATAQIVAPMARMSDEAAVPLRPAPALGQDTDEVLAGLGYRRDEIGELRQSGLV